MVLELEKERVLRREAEHLRREAEQLAQENAEKLSQAQSQLAELKRDHHLDTDLPHQDSDEEGLDGETMSIQEAIDLEHTRLQAHCASPESGQPFQHTTEAITLAANMLLMNAEPPECQVCHEGVFGDGLHPTKMMSHRLGMCKHYDWDATELKPDQGIQRKIECADLHRPLELYGPDRVTPVTAEGLWGCTFLKTIDLLHSFGDCLDLATP